MKSVFFGGFQYSFLILLSVMAIEFISTSLKESLLQQLITAKNEKMPKSLPT
jgi:phage-related holin